MAHKHACQQIFFIIVVAIISTLSDVKDLSSVIFRI